MDGLPQPRRAALALPERPKHNAETYRCDPTLILIARGRCHPSGEFDGNQQGEVDALRRTVFVKRINSLTERHKPRRPFGRLIQSRKHLDTHSNGNGITAQRMLLHGGLKKYYSLVSRGLALLGLLSVELAQCGIERLRRAVQIIVLGPVGNLRQHGSDEVVFIARPVGPV